VSLEIGFDAVLAGAPRPGSYSLTIDANGSGFVVDGERLELAGISGGRDLLIDGHRSVARLSRADGGIAESFHAADAIVLGEVTDERSYPMAHQLRRALRDVALIDRDPLATTEAADWMFAGQSTGRARRRLSLTQLLTEVASREDLLKHLVDLLRTLIPGIRDVTRKLEVGDKATIHAQLEVVEDGLEGSTPIADLSAGTRQILVLAALHVLPEPPRVILLEEPESGLHVGALQALVDLLRSLAARSTVVATTHSPGFVGLLDPEREVFALSRDAEGTRAVSLAAALHSKKWLDGFGSTAEAFVRAGSERRR